MLKIRFWMMKRACNQGSESIWNRREFLGGNPERSKWLELRSKNERPSKQRELEECVKREGSKSSSKSMGEPDGHSS